MFKNIVFICIIFFCLQKNKNNITGLDTRKKNLLYSHDYCDFLKKYSVFFCLDIFRTYFFSDIFFGHILLFTVIKTFLISLILPYHGPWLRFNLTRKTFSSINHATEENRNAFWPIEDPKRDLFFVEIISFLILQWEFLIVALRKT